MGAHCRWKDYREEYLKETNLLPSAQFSVILSAVSGCSLYMVKSNCHRVEVLLQLQTELDVILALKKKAVRCLKSIKTSGTGEMAALTEAQPAHRGKRLSFFTQHSLDNIYNTVSGFGTPTQLINPSEFSRGPPGKPELDRLPWGERSRVGGCSSLQQGQLGGHGRAAPQGDHGGAGARLFTAVPAGRKRDNGHTRRQEAVRLDTRSNVFTMKTAQQWDGLPREALRPPTLEVSKTRLARALSDHDRPQRRLYCEQESGKRPPEVRSHLT